jgi:hypothetical protein
MSTEHTQRPAKGVTNGCTVRLEHSTVRLETGPAGTIARIDRPGEPIDYAGPLPEETADALLAVGRVSQGERP